MLTKLLSIYIEELLAQAKDQQLKEGDDTIRVEHVEKVIARFLMNF
jgi:hypothetical protein